MPLTSLLHPPSPFDLFLLQVGDFASAIDEVFETLDEITVETLLVVIMRWMGVDEPGEDLSASMGPHHARGPSPGVEEAGGGGEGDHGSCGDDSAHSTEKDLLEEDFLDEDLVDDEGAVVTPFGALSSPRIKEPLASSQAVLSGLQVEAPSSPRGHDKGPWWWWRWLGTKVKSKASRFLLRRRLRRQLGDASLSPWEDVVGKFQKLDSDNQGGLSPDMMELLLSWAFDMDLEPHEWQLLAEILDEKRTGEGGNGGRGGSRSHHISRSISGPTILRPCALPCLATTCLATIAIYACDMHTHQSVPCLYHLPSFCINGSRWLASGIYLLPHELHPEGRMVVLRTNSSH